MHRKFDHRVDAVRAVTLSLTARSVCVWNLIPALTASLTPAGSTDHGAKHGPLISVFPGQSSLAIAGDLNRLAVDLAPAALREPTATSTLKITDSAWSGSDALYARRGGDGPAEGAWAKTPSRQHGQ